MGRHWMRRGASIDVVNSDDGSGIFVMIQAAKILLLILVIRIYPQTQEHPIQPTDWLRDELGR